MKDCFIRGNQVIPILDDQLLPVFLTITLSSDIFMEKGDMVINIINDRHRNSLTFWTVFFGFVLIPILAFSIELRRYFYVRAKIAKAAVTVEISQRVFVVTGELQTTSNLNNWYLSRYSMNKVVAGINVDSGKDKVSVQVSANLYRLFPSVLPNVLVTETR